MSIKENLSKETNRFNDDKYKSAGYLALRVTKIEADLRPGEVSCLQRNNFC